jgi:hypothetical protein
MSVDNLRVSSNVDFSPKPWESGSLHPAIINRIEQTLKTMPYVKYLRYTYDLPIENTKSKLESLQQCNSQIVSNLIAKSKELKPTFYAAKTLSFETHDALHKGLITIFVTEDRPFSDHEKILLLAKLGYKKPKSHREGDQMALRGEKIASNKAVNYMKFGTKTSIDLSTMGTQPGIVGPWKLTAASTPIYVIPPTHEGNARRSELDIVDFALSFKESLLVLGINQGLDVIRKIAKLGQYEDSLHVL